MIGRTTWLTALLVAATSLTAQAQQNVVILLDDSGSMSSFMRSDGKTRKMAAAKSAIKVVLEQLPSNANVGLAILNGGRDPWVIPFGPIDKSDLADSLQRIIARGATPLGKHMKIGADALLEARNNQHYGTYKLLIITDGEAGDANLVERYLPEINSRGIIVDVIGVDMATKHSLATKTSSYRSADDPESLRNAISEVLAESSNDDGDAGESDFELLAAFPDEVASSVLTALSSPSNDPIGQTGRASAGAGTSQNAAAASGGAQAQSGHSQATQDQYPVPVRIEDKRSRGVGGLVCLAPLAFLGIIIIRVLFSANRRR